MIREEIIDSLFANVCIELRKLITSGVLGDDQPLLVRTESDGVFVVTIVGHCPPSAALSPRQREVLNLIGLDLGNAGIARHLGLSEDTVHYHVARLLDKLKVSGRTALVRKAALYGLLNSPA